MEHYIFKVSGILLGIGIAISISLYFKQAINDVANYLNKK